MARKPITDMSAWPSLSLEGNLIAPAMIAKIDQRQAPEQSPEEYGVRKGLQIREEIATAFRVGQSHFDAFAKIEQGRKLLLSSETSRKTPKTYLRPRRPCRVSAGFETSRNQRNRGAARSG